MRILFLSHYFPPEVNAPASRTFEHCRAWTASGHRVTVVTCAPNHPRGIVYEGYRNRLWSRERHGDIDVIRLWTTLAANERFFWRSLNYLSFLFSCVVAAPFLPGADVVVTTSPQFFNGLAGYPVSWFKRARWVLEIRDLWPESIVAVGGLKRGAIVRWLERLEFFAYRHADLIVTVTDSFKRYVVAKGITAAKIEVIKNGADLNLYRPGTGDASLVHELGLAGKFVASYFGTHGMAHHLETILDAAHLLRARTDIVFLMAGDGAERNRLEELQRSRGLTNVQILGQQPKSRLPSLWDLSSASIVHLRASPVFTTVIPSKIFESLAMEKPVLLGVEGEAADLIRDSGGGVCFKPESADQLAGAVLSLAADREAAGAMGKRGREYVVAHFDRERLARRFQSLLEELAGYGSVPGSVVPPALTAKPGRRRSPSPTQNVKSPQHNTEANRSIL